MEKKSLAEKKQCGYCINGCDEPHSCVCNSCYLYVGDVKEAIKELLRRYEKVSRGQDYTPVQKLKYFYKFDEVIKRIFGKELCE